MSQRSHPPLSPPAPAVGDGAPGGRGGTATAAGPEASEQDTCGRVTSGTEPSLDPDGLADERLTARLLAKSPAENFPVASRLLPAALRRDLLAVYAYARLVDDLGDEAAGDRARLLDLVEADVRRVYDGGEPRLPVVRAVAATIRAHRIPEEPFRRLIAANRRDQEVTHYATYADLLDYCTLSANPVGRIVLHVFDVATPEREELSDRVCSALQVVEHLQDVAEDLRRGRVYLPQEDLDRFGCSPEDLALPVAPARVRRLVAFERRRAGALLDAGAPLVGTLPGLARLAVAGYVAGGRAALAAVRAAGDDVLRAVPRPRRSRLLVEWVRLLVGGGA
jgi:squalene synthase HpnC